MALARNLVLMLTALATPALAQAPAKAPVAPTAAAQPAVAPAAPAKADDWPTGAPRTDYEFTAWCYGVLRQHMELYNQVKPELLAISKRWKTEEEDEKSYGEQQAAGKMYLAQFSRALELAEKASPRPINTQGAAAIEQGRKMWNQFDTVEKNMQAYSWMNWELPEKCPKVAVALENKALLMAPALRANLSASGGPGAPKAAEVKKPEPDKTAAAKPAADSVGQLIKEQARKP